MRPVVGLAGRSSPCTRRIVSCPRRAFGFQRPTGRSPRAKRVITGATMPESPSTESVVSPSSSVSASEDFVYASGPAENDGEGTDDIPVMYEM